MDSTLFSFVWTPSTSARLKPEESSSSASSHTHTTLRIFLTGRYNVEDEVIKALVNLSPKSVNIAANEEDIRICLAEKIALDPDPEAMDETLKEEIIEKIVSLSYGM